MRVEPITTKPATNRCRGPRISFLKITYPNNNAQIGEVATSGAAKVTPPKLTAYIIERMPKAFIIPLIENHLNPSKESPNNLYFPVIIRITVSMREEVDPKINVAKKGLGFSNSPAFTIG